MGALEGRVAVITGAGRGLGRAHALLFAHEGAKVVVNDLGSSPAGAGRDPGPAQMVVDEIRAAGGDAVASGHDVADGRSAEEMVNLAIEHFGGLDVLVNNAGILRDRMLVNMTEEEWDDVVRVHLRGHFLPSRSAAAYWRERSKAGDPVRASLINTTSTSGLMANPGQTNYGAAKTAIATFTQIAQKELGRYGVRCNAVAPAALTRLTARVGDQERGEADGNDHDEDGKFDVRDPANVSPFVAYLATGNCPLEGKIFFVRGGAVHLVQPWTFVDRIDTEGRWTIDDLVEAAERWATVSFDDTIPLD
jgi:NAD(P)-dependent dehydrogenase (short-subunit alcohol dehydrogenase family)